MDSRISLMGLRAIRCRKTLVESGIPVEGMGFQVPYPLNGSSNTSSDDNCQAGENE